MRRLFLIVVLGLPVMAMPAAASDEKALELCEQLQVSEDMAVKLCQQLQDLVIERSAVDFAPTKLPLVRHYMPDRNYIWCLGIGFAALDSQANGVILSFGREVDGNLWLDFWEERETPTFYWTN